MKKKLFALMMCLALALAFCVSCGSSSQEAEPEAEPETEATEAAPVEQRTVYVTPDWVKSVIDGSQEGYENYVLAEVAYPTDPRCNLCIHPVSRGCYLQRRGCLQSPRS